MICKMLLSLVGSVLDHFDSQKKKSEELKLRVDMTDF